MSPASFSLEGRRALVTGGATGIGRSVASAFAAAGADVAVTVHRRPADEAVRAIASHGRAHAVLETDLAALDRAAAGELFDDAEDRLGPIDLLVNNAGIIRRTPAADHAESDWRAVTEVNLHAPWFLAQEGGARMLERDGGSVINVASLLSFQGGITVPGYAASKHAVAGLTKALANEWAASGVNVNAIAPGYIATENTRPLREDATRAGAILARIPAARWGEPEDIAGAAVFLASPAARYVHGHVLVVDGGWMAR